MWRNLTLALFLLILAHTANATSNSNFENKTSIQSAHSLKMSSSNLDFSFTLLNEETPEEHVNLPKINRACSSLFNHEIQLTPDYYLAITFFEMKLSAALFKNLTNPGVRTPWFEQISHRSNSSRISGWKDSNILYTSRITYYS